MFSFGKQDHLFPGLYSFYQQCFSICMVENIFPDIRKYLNIQLYIKDVYEFRKKSDKNFSYATWAQEIGIKNRAYLRLIITGRRLVSDDVAELIKNHLKLNDEEKEYFTYLVLYSQSKHQDQKVLYGRKLTELSKKEVHQVVLENYDFLSDPYLPLVRTLLSYEDFEGSIPAVSKLLSLSPIETQKSIEQLNSLGLIEEKATPQTWKAKNSSVKITDHPHDLAVEFFHKNSLQNAIKAQQLPAEERKYRSVMMALSEVEYQQLIEDFHKFMNDQLSKHDSKTVKDRRLYQMNFNLIPLSKKIKDC